MNPSELNNRARPFETGQGGFRDRRYFLVGGRCHSVCPRGGSPNSRPAHRTLPQTRECCLFLQLCRDVQQQSLKWPGRFPPRRRSMAGRWCCCAVTSSWSTWDWSWARRSSSAITSRGWSRANSERWRRLLVFSLATRQDVFYCTRTESSVDPAQPAALWWWWWFFYFCSFQLVPQQPAGSFQKMHTRKLTLHCTRLLPPPYFL